MKNNKQFSLYLTGLIVSTIGNVIYELAISYWVLEVTGSKALMSFALSIGMIIRMILLPVAGAVADSLDKKWIMVSMDAIRGVLMVVMGILCMRGNLTVSLVFASVVVSSLAETVFSPSASTLILDLLSKEDIIQGQSLQNTLLSIVNVVVNSLAGTVVLLLGIGPAIIANGISFLISALSEMFIHSKRKVYKPLSLKGTFQTVLDGGKLIFINQNMKMFFATSFFMNLFSAGLIAMLLPRVLEIGYEVSSYSLLSGAISIGGILGGMYLSSHTIEENKRYKVMICCFIVGIITELTAFQVSSILVIGLCMLISMLTSAIANGIFGGLFMMMLPEENSGTVYSFMASSGSFGSAVSTALYGVLADHMSLSFVACGGCLLTLIPIFIFARMLQTCTKKL